MHRNGSKVRGRKIKPWPRRFFQPSDMFGGQLQIERAQILFELLQCACTDDRGRDGRPRVYPGKRDARRGSLQLPCNLVEDIDQAERTFRKRLGYQRAAAGLGLRSVSTGILAAQNTRRERTPSTRICVAPWIGQLFPWLV